MRLLLTLVCGVCGALLAPVVALVVGACCFRSDEVVGLALLFTPVLWIAGYLSGVIGVSAVWERRKRA
jgi:hypothetical protein